MKVTTQHFIYFTLLLSLVGSQADAKNQDSVQKLEKRLKATQSKKSETLDLSGYDFQAKYKVLEGKDLKSVPVIFHFLFIFGRNLQAAINPGCWNDLFLAHRPSVEDHLAKKSRISHCAHHAPGCNRHKRTVHRNKRIVLRSQL